jgi:hypothetical protein
MWYVQVLPAIHAARLEGFFNGFEKNLEIEKDSKKPTVPNPDHAVWRVRD